MGNANAAADKPADNAARQSRQERFGAVVYVLRGERESVCVCVCVCVCVADLFFLLLIKAIHRPDVVIQKRKEKFASEEELAKKKRQVSDG